MIPLTRAEKVKDLGVWFDENLSFKDHMHNKINMTYMMLGLIKLNFRHLTMPVNCTKAWFDCTWTTAVLFGHCIEKGIWKHWKRSRKEQ